LKSKFELKSRNDLPKLFNEHGLTGYGAEVGVLCGAFSKHLLSEWQGEKIWLIDAWRKFEGKIDYNNGDHNDQLNNLARTFMNIYEFGVRTAIIRDLSTEAAKIFQEGFFDWVYIDAGHGFHDVAEDLDAWWPKVREGGLFCGDDYWDGEGRSSPYLREGEWVSISTQFNVKSAVDEFAKRNSLSVEVPNTDPEEMKQWLIWK